MARRRGYDWDALPLGLETDAEIAGRLGCAESTVARARRERYIPKPDRILRTGQRPTTIAQDMTCSECGERLGIARFQGKILCKSCLCPETPCRIEDHVHQRSPMGIGW